MQIAAETAKYQSLPSATHSEFSATVRRSQFFHYRAIRRNGVVVSLKSPEIPVPVTKVLLAVNRRQGAIFAELPLQAIDDRIGGSIDQGCQAGSEPSWDPLIGPIG